MFIGAFSGLFPFLSAGICFFEKYETWRSCGFESDKNNPDKYVLLRVFNG